MSTLSSAGIGILTIATLGVSLFVGITDINAAHAETTAQNTVAVDACSTNFVGAALDLTAGEGDGAALDKANADCTTLGAQLQPMLTLVPAEFDAALANLSPELQEQAAAVDAKLTPDARDHIGTLSPEDQVRYLDGLAATEGE